MTRWIDRTPEQRTAYIRKSYAKAPIRSLTGAIVHEQTAADVVYAEAQFDAWLVEHDAEVIRDAADRFEAHATALMRDGVWSTAPSAIAWLRGQASSDAAPETRA